MQIYFKKVRCPLCGKIVLEVANTSRGHQRGQCTRCKTLITIQSLPDKEPIIIKTENKIIANTGTLT